MSSDVAFDVVAMFSNGQTLQTVLLVSSSILGALLVVKCLAWFFAPTYDLYKVPAPPSLHWFLGHVPALLRNDYIFKLIEWANQYPGIFRLNLAGKPMIIVTDPAATALILGRDADSVPTRSDDYKNIVDKSFDGFAPHISFFGTQDEEHWKVVRKATAPAFNMNNMRVYFPRMLPIVERMLEDLGSEQQAQGAVVLEPHIARMQVANVLHAEMEISYKELAAIQGLPDTPEGLAVAEQQGRQLLADVDFICSISNKAFQDPLYRVFIRLRPLMALLSKEGAELKRCCDRVHRFYKNMIRVWRSRPLPGEDDTLLWQCLAKLRDPATGQLLSESRLLPELGVFMFAGYDTTNSGIGWVVYTLACFPEVQARVYEELVEAGLAGPSARRPDLGDLAALPYTNAVINEVLRLFPPAGTAVHRTTTKPTRVAGYLLPAGVELWPGPAFINRVDGLWGDGNAFRPERWLEKEAACVRRPDGSVDTSLKRYLTFALGPKDCIGQNLGLAVLRLVVVGLVGRYHISLHPDMGTWEDLPRHIHMALTTKIRDLKIQIKPRA
mmetsp:Transcript_29305/g.64847  ORF Transcript_29305/g.64847 Transcript_29305/m.64847 type:complete len:554 (-) Transcript_29305:627-2288(-)|eukprot:CAMPEP_0202903292 /NCGR_PEP_ID=MMETSP1392-20130828/23597_1 /ASSEMBLY_ACC=CAM_ASM_000868 /TAXON_ID=225041 /ORGANISM="Chlamydomonas chlamydogama, Strain SAG 11-48b" /LENGTH=553 /DNA_ID=CAMNT_0049590397 /DNA_START=175 /DNA_END=1836 /DNA_ORIENTATION=+